VHSKTTIIESQPDWLTVTHTGEASLPVFRAWAKRCIAWEEVKANKQRNFSAFGYEGVACGRVRWGAREDSDMVQLSGDVAAKELNRAMDLATNVSRLDLAVTVHQEPMDPGLEASHYASFLAAPRSEGRKASGTLVQSSDGGATFYLGKRTSDVMLRVYNKAVESDDEHYKDCHRYELEIKGDRAILAATDVANSVDVGAFCQEVVHDWCTVRGVTPAFDVAQPRRLQPGLTRRSDEDTKLEWLMRSVRPTVSWLREFGDQGRILRALGYHGDSWTEVFRKDEDQDTPTRQHGEGMAHE